jgi:asparagine synthase (glutamine-hydrolysing)
MCGIVGVFDYSRSEPSVTEAQVAGMRDSMRHRGPDGEGSYYRPEGKIALGHRRLAILDLSSAGLQPMADSTGRYWMVFNGEIYNFRELRRELEAQGLRFRTQTDTEVLLELYRESGPAMLERLRGMFALAIWDSRERKLWLARDRIGIKPLYYSFHNGSFLFASEIKALLAHPDIIPALNEEGLIHYLSFLTVPAPQTLFRDIHKLPPGCTLTVDASGGMQSERYWDVLDHIEPLQETREEAIAERLLELLRESIRYRMVSDVPFGVFLSGGIDSSTNVALMAELMDRPVETFSIAFRGEAELNEFVYARQVARLFGANHHEIQIGEEEVLEFLPGLVHHQDEPIADPVCVPLYYVAKLAKDSGVTVCQVGEGSDELFAYPWWVKILRFHDLSAPFRSLPTALRGVLVSLVQRCSGSGPRRSELLRRLGNGESLFWGGAEAMAEEEKRELLSTRLRRQFAGRSSYEIVRQYYEEFRERSPIQDYLQFMTYLDLNLRLPELLLMRVDKMTMANSVEGRVPFLDHKFVELAMSLPARVKIHNHKAKHILKKAAERVLPRDIVYRRKVGFGAPVHTWFHTRLGKLARQKLDQFVHDYDYFDRGTVGRICQTGASHYWHLLNLVLWHEQWIEGRVQGAHVVSH